MVHSLGIYRRGLRHLAKRLKEGKPSAIRRAAEIFAEQLPPDAVVIPMPSHNGRASVTLAVADEISALRKDVSICDCLGMTPHAGMYVAKKAGNGLPDIAVRLIGERPEGRVCLIDNVIDTGRTFTAAKKTLTDAELYVIAHTEISIARGFVA